MKISRNYSALDRVGANNQPKLNIVRVEKLFSRGLNHVLKPGPQSDPSICHNSHSIAMTGSQRSKPIQRSSGREGRRRAGRGRATERHKYCAKCGGRCTWNNAQHIPYETVFRVQLRYRRDCRRARVDGQGGAGKRATGRRERSDVFSARNTDVACRPWTATARSTSIGASASSPSSRI